MGENLLVVRADEVREQLGFEGFLGLPAEEIERLHGCVAVQAMAGVLAERDPAYQTLVTFTAIHFNYAWLTHPRAALPGSAAHRSLGLLGNVMADDGDHLFLDDYPKLAVQRELNELGIREPFELRLAGLLADDGAGAARRRLGLVYVARLASRDGAKHAAEAAGLRFCGPGELLQERDGFEPWSQVLIDNLHAL
jgi:predicted NUDIX family phosphoesterase